MPSPLRIYLAGELFSAKHLLGNAVLAQAIWDLSEGRYVGLVPQDLEQRENTAHGIRDQDLRALFACDVALFHYDGPELDSGTVVEFLFAKFADIPAVLLRTDFRIGGDQIKGGEPWNLMTSFFPRTKTVLLNAMELYHEGLNRAEAEEIAKEKRGIDASMVMIDRVARECLSALDAVRAEPPALSRELAGPVYEGRARLPGFKDGGDGIKEELAKCLAAKQEKKLL